MWKMVVLAAFVVGLTGCVEATFKLAEESRLPRWFEVPEGATREDLSVTMSYYIWTSRKAVFRLKNKKRFWSCQRVVGNQLGLHPIKLKNPPEGYPEGYPSYEVITVNGISDIIEHRVRGPIFHVTDDPAIWMELEVER